MCMKDKENRMRKSWNQIIVFCLMLLFLAAGAGCGIGQKQEGKGSAYATALEALEAVAGAYTQEDQFAMYGGDQEHAVMDAPGSFDISKTEELEATLGLPADLADQLEDAASMVHMMNGNVFTGAAYRLKDNADKNAFAQAVQSALLKKQWLCGQPDTLVVLETDGTYVITAYGEAGVMETFRSYAQSVFQDVKVLTEAPIV